MRADEGAEFVSEEISEGHELEEPPELSPQVPLGVVLGGAIALSAALAFVLRAPYADSEKFFYLALAPYALVGLFASFVLARARLLGPLLRLKGGDFTVGALLGGVLIAGTWLGRTTVASLGENTAGWLYAVYLQIGDPRRFGSITWTALALAFAFFHEVFFHGLVQEILEERLGPRKGYLWTVGLSALVFLPSVFTLRVAEVGLNPLVFLASLLCALILGAVRRLTGRLTTNIIARGVFLYFTLAQFRLPGM